MSLFFEKDSMVWRCSSVSRVSSMLKALGYIPQALCNLDMVAYISNPSTWESEFHLNSRVQD